MELSKKIDLHAHVISDKGLTFPNDRSVVTPEELMAYYDRIGVDLAVLQPFVGLVGFYECNTNREIYSIVQKYPNRFAWFCNLDPQMGLNNEATDFVRILNYYKSIGAKGVGELVANIPFDDPRVLNLFAACEKCDMPVLFHVGNLGGDYGLVDGLGLYKLEKVLQMFPKLTFIGHSQKFWAEISADVTEENRDGYPQGPVTPGRLSELFRKYPNLHADISAYSGYNAMSRDPEYGYAFMEEFQDRLYFGLDFVLYEDLGGPYNQQNRFLDDAVTAGNISYETYVKICRGNALRLLNRPV